MISPSGSTSVRITVNLRPDDTGAPATPPSPGLLGDDFVRQCLADIAQDRSGAFDTSAMASAAAGGGAGFLSGGLGSLSGTRSFWSGMLRTVQRQLLLMLMREPAADATAADRLSPAAAADRAFVQGPRGLGLPLAHIHITDMPGAPRHYGHHTGVDFGAPTGTPIHAVADGRVVRAGVQGGYGICVTVRHADGTQTRYAHCSARNVSVGDHVKQGQVIGKVGATGAASGPHLHFDAIAADGRYLNPLQYLRQPLKGRAVA